MQVMENAQMVEPQGPRLNAECLNDRTTVTALTGLGKSLKFRLVIHLVHLSNSGCPY